MKMLGANALYIKCSGPNLMILWLFAQVQINNNMENDTFTELPVSLVLFSLICIDVVERIRHCRLTGQGEHSTLNTLHKPLT